MSAMNPAELERMRANLEELSLRKQLPLRHQTDKPILKYDTTLTRPVQLFNQGDTLPRRDGHSQIMASTEAAGSAAVQHGVSNHGSALHGSSHQGSAYHESSTGKTSSRSSGSSHHGSPHHSSSHHGSPKGQNQLRMASSVSNLSSPSMGVNDPYNRPVSAKEVIEKSHQHRHHRQRKLQSHSGSSGAQGHSMLSGCTAAVLQDSGAATLQLNSFLRPQSGSARRDSIPSKPSPPQKKEKKGSAGLTDPAELSPQGKKMYEETPKGSIGGLSSQSAKANLQQAFTLASTTSAATNPAVTGLPPRPRDANTQGNGRNDTPPSRGTPISTVRNPYYSPNRPYADVSSIATERKQHTPSDSSKPHSGRSRRVQTPPSVLGHQAGENHKASPLMGRIVGHSNSSMVDHFLHLGQEASSCKAGMEESGAAFHHPSTTASTLLSTKVGTLRKMPVTNTLTGTLYYKKSFREATRLVEQKQKKGVTTATTVLEHRPVGDGAPSSRQSVLSEKLKGSSRATVHTDAGEETEEEEDDVSTPSGERLPGDGEASIEDLDDDDDGIDDIYEDSENDSNDGDSDDYTISSNVSQQSSASTVRMHPSVRLQSKGRPLSSSSRPSTNQSARSNRAAGAGEERTRSFVRPVTVSATEELMTQPALRQSLFPAIPPTLNFVPEGEKVEQLPWEIRKLLKWRMSPITPNIVKSALGRINFRITKKNHDWLGCFGKHMKANAFKALREYQKLNHFPGSFQLGRKDRLWRNLSKMQVSFGKKEFGFFPQTYVLPQDLKQLKRTWEDSSSRQKWIIKPPASARGIGIKVINKWSQVPRRRPVIVQKYLSRPLLINDSKFDMRIYVYVTSYDPLRAYVFEDGLARFASCKYSASMKNLSNKFMHLTNYSINKRNADYQSNTDDSVCQGHKWSLKSLWNYLKKQGVNTQVVWDSIKDIVVKTLISAEGPINSMVKSNVRSRYIVHELFGFDIMLDDMLRPWILEVNISPSLHSNSQLDINVKGQMIKDMMNLAGFRVPDKSDVHPSHSSTSAVDLSSHIPSNDYCMDKRLFTNQLASDERAKHAHFCHRHQDEQVLQTMLDTLTPDDVRMLTESIDEDGRKGNFIRVFPTPSTRRYLRYMEQPRYYNLLLDQWVTRFNRMEQRGIALLQGLCEEGLHLENPTDSARHQWCPPSASAMMSARDKMMSPLKKESHTHIKSSPNLSRLPKMRGGGGGGGTSSMTLLSPPSPSPTLCRPLDPSR